MKYGKLKCKKITDSKFLVNVDFICDKAHDNCHADGKTGCSVFTLHLAVCRLLINEVSRVHMSYIISSHRK